MLSKRVRVRISEELLREAIKGHEKRKKTCLWNMGTPHGGVIMSATMFNNQITVPICTNHLQEHKIVMGLFIAGYEIEDCLMTKGIEWCKQEYEKLVKAGTINPDSIQT